MQRRRKQHRQHRMQRLGRVMAGRHGLNRRNSVSLAPTSSPRNPEPGATLGIPCHHGPVSSALSVHVKHNVLMLSPARSEQRRAASDASLAVELDPDWPIALAVGQGNGNMLMPVSLGRQGRSGITRPLKLTWPSVATLLRVHAAERQSLDRRAVSGRRHCRDVIRQSTTDSIEIKLS